MSYLVRASKFRHVYGEAKKADQCFVGVKAANTTPEAHMIKGNTKFFGLSWAAGGGGTLAVMPLEKTGRMTGKVPMISGHTGTILDFDFNPFDDFQVVTASDDCTVKAWQIPEEGLSENLSDPLVSLEGHQKKCHIVNYHPTAEGIVTSASHDHTIRVWDLVQAKAAYSFEDVYSEIIWSISWNKNGSLFATSSKDKQCRILDPRAQQVVNTFQAHEGGKPQKVIWAGNLDKIITIGFSKQSGRELKMWDPKNVAAPVKSLELDVGSGMNMGMLDEDTSVLYMGAKGDSSIKYFELLNEEPHIFSLSSSSFSKPQKGVCMLPKLAGDVMGCEVARVLRLVNDTVEVVPFKVPRKSSEFQSDIFPDTKAPVAVMTAEEWQGGKDADPKTMSARPGEGVSAAPRKVVKTAFQLQKEVEEKDKKIAELEAKVAELTAKLGSA